MSALKKTRAAQTPQFADFVFNWNDTAVDTNGVATNTFATNGAVFPIMSLPVGAVVVGGEVVVDTAEAAATTYTVSVGDAGSATRYASTVSIKSQARTALTLTGFRLTAKDILATIATTGTAPSAGKVAVRVMFIIPGKADGVTAGGPY